MKKVATFRELEVYEMCGQLAKEIFGISRKFPREETYSLTDQIRRSSRSVGAQIAEAWGKRRYEKHFVSKLTDADAEQMETQHWIQTASECGYISKATSDDLMKKCSSIENMLQSMIRKSKWFCL